MGCHRGSQVTRYVEEELERYSAGRKLEVLRAVRSVEMTRQPFDIMEIGTDERSTNGPSTATIEQGANTISVAKMPTM